MKTLLELVSEAEVESFKNLDSLALYNFITKDDQIEYFKSIASDEDMFTKELQKEAKVLNLNVSLKDIDEVLQEFLKPSDDSIKL
jgi:hypothetical protein